MSKDTPKTLILGIGNGIRGDDVIGILIARELKKDPIPGCEIKELETAGFEILDEITGYDRVIIIDAMRTEDEKQIGKIELHDLEDRQPTPTLLPSHGFDFAGLVHAWKKASPKPFPKKITFLLVKVKDVDHFREGLSDRVKGIFEGVVGEVERRIEILMRN